MTWFTAYLVIAPVTLGWAVFRSHRLDDPGLMRCAWAIIAQFAVTQAWFAMMSGAWSGQPWLFYVAAHAVSTAIILRKPASRGNAVLGGVTLFGMTISAVHGARSLFYGYSAEADWSYWYLIFLTGWAALIVLLGWSHVDTGRRVAARIRRAGGSLFRGADHQGLGR